MTTFSKSIYIETSLKALYDFHLDTNNIKKITPPDTKVEILEIDPPLKKGSIVKLRATKFFIPQMWEVEIEKLDELHLIVDLAKKSPFFYWRHEHRFSQEGGKVKMEDYVEFIPPFGILGDLVTPLILRDLDKMFTYRHKKTKEIFEGVK